MKNTFPIIITILFLTACSTPSTQVQLNNKSYEAYRPPNCIQIAENLFADETEIANVDYKEYIAWTKKLYGGESKEFLATLPDTNVWRSIVYYSAPFMDNYYQHPSYDNHPLVGVTLEQAKDYTKWRTERVAEMILVHKGFIKAESSDDVATNFTVERYVNGNFDWIIKKESFMLAKYKIPTIEEWEQMAGVHSKFRYGIDSLSQYNKKILKNCKTLFATSDIPSSVSNKHCHKSSYCPEAARSNSKNIHKLYNTIGNVSELVDTPNTSKGGSWHHPIKEIEITKNDTFTQANAWTGFRNVCTFELVTIPD